VFENTVVTTAEIFFGKSHMLSSCIHTQLLALKVCHSCIWFT